MAEDLDQCVDGKDLVIGEALEGAGESEGAVGVGSGLGVSGSEGLPHVLHKLIHGLAELGGGHIDLVMEGGLDFEIFETFIWRVFHGLRPPNMFQTK